MTNQSIFTVRVCGHCGEEVESKGGCSEELGVEIWDVCSGCGVVEGPTEEISEEEWEKRQ